MKILDYINETRAEMRHVNWPTRKQTVSFTILVIAFSLGTAFFLGFFDFIFTFLLELFLI
ncbi:MAG: preprotein translocase subunit SecE [Parcubacteria group bacterium]|nr:preprotein translocase subunit SecE [Parcubacteria group bacterium]MBI2049040.1 preprotein translocase subunit SecE [Parcubacteria group bacterium]